MSDDLWNRLEPLLLQGERHCRYPVRKPLPDLEVVCGIFYVLHTGIQREYLSKELGFRLEPDVLAADWNESLCRARRVARRGGQSRWKAATVERRSPEPIRFDDRGESASAPHSAAHFDGNAMCGHIVVTRGQRILRRSESLYAT
ncbi:transposase [Streptomyces sp. NPDC004752]